MEFGLNQLSGNKELLFKMFDRFTQDYANVVGELRTSVNDGKTNDIRHKVHTIKGVAGNLGMNALYVDCRALEDAVKRGETDISNHLVAFEKALTATLAEIASLKTEESERTGVSQLKYLVEQNEFISGDSVEQLLRDSNLDEQTKQDIVKAINNLDYPTALKLL